MAEKKTQVKNESERIYVIPLMAEWNKVPRYKRSKKAIRAIREFVVKHMKIRDGDLNKIKIDKYLNEEVWYRGIKKPPKKIKVRAVKDEKAGIVRVYLVDYKDNLKFKKLREERVVKTSEQKKKEKEARKPVEETVEIEKEGKTEEEIKEEKEKVKSNVEAAMKTAEMQHKKMKHETQQQKGPRHQQRKALQK